MLHLCRPPERIVKILSHLQARYNVSHVFIATDARYNASDPTNAETQLLAAIRAHPAWKMYDFPKDPRVPEMSVVVEMYLLTRGVFFVGTSTSTLTQNVIGMRANNTSTHWLDPAFAEIT